jgi:hypothetical protein
MAEDGWVLMTSGKTLLNGSRCCWNREDNVDHIDAFIRKKRLDTAVHLDLGKACECHSDVILNTSKWCAQYPRYIASHCMAENSKRK